MALQQQRPRKVGPYKPGTTGYEDSHVEFSLPISLVGHAKAGNELMLHKIQLCRLDRNRRIVGHQVVANPRRQPISKEVIGTGVGRQLVVIPVSRHVRKLVLKKRLHVVTDAGIQVYPLRHHLAERKVRGIRRGEGACYGIAKLMPKPNGNRRPFTNSVGGLCQTFEVVKR